MTEEQRIALGFRPRTIAGWWFWLRYWSPPAMWWQLWTEDPMLEEDTKRPTCTDFEPDANGVCRHCGQRGEAHAWDMGDDICAVCGKWLGFGIRALHIGRCEEHR
jgi:hypothetical protein